MTEAIFNTKDNIDDDDNNLLKEIGEHINVPMAPEVGISALAMNFALKFCDINTIKEGQIYQQLKLEGVNIRPGWHLEEVFNIANQIEIQLINSPNRLAEAVLMQIANDLDKELEENEIPPK